jgi:hypothetical protein
MPKTEEDFIPKAVKDQEAKAIEAQKAAKAGQEPGPTNPAEPVKPEPTNPTPANEPAPVVNEPVKPADGKGEDFEHKFNVLQGMYNKDINEMRTALDQSKDMMSNQQKIIDSLNAAITANPAPAPASEPAPANVIEHLKADDFTAYGAEMEDLIKLVNELAHRIAVLEKRPASSNSPDTGVIERVKRIEANQTRSLKDRFYDDMDRMMPDWGTKNKDPKFGAWLEGIDDVSQIQRKIMLKHAFTNWNSAQVVAIFNSYFGGPINAPGANTDPANPLAGQVVPNTTGNADGGDGGQPPKKYATKDELLKAQDDFVHQRITEPDFDKIAASFQAGIKAGVNKQT